jgi:hypothetical protein
MTERDDLQPRPGGLKTLTTGLNLAELDLNGGDGFWEEVQRYARQSQLEEQLDVAMQGRPAPRVWAFLESPGAGAAAAAAGLAVASLLADRGQAVVLVDADEQEPRITRWLGRTEQEGWIDMIRFGASLHAASVPLPSRTRRGSVLGVGSFAPTGVNPEEVGELLDRLRRQADDLILVLPAKLRSAPWLEAAHIRLLCWDLLARSASDTEKILTELERMGAKPDALLGFGVEEFTAIQDKLREAPAEAPVSEPDQDDETQEIDVRTDADPDDEPVLTPAADDQGEPRDWTAGMDAVGTPAPDPLAADGKPQRRRTSGVFVIVAAVAVVALALLGVFLRSQLDPGRQDIVPAVPPIATAPPTPTTAPPQEQPVVPPPATPDEAAVAAADEPEAATPAAPEPEPAPTPTPEPEIVAAPRPEPEPTPPPVAEPDAADAVDAPTAFDPAPFRKPAGADGWTLWLYSFADEEGATIETRRLARRGIQTEVRAVDLPDRGRWYRVYAGSFADRNSARAAVAGLRAELNHDWVVPARF